VQLVRNSVDAVTEPTDRRFETHNGQIIECTTEAASPLVAEFFAGYDAAFVLPNEKEDLPGFVACLALNSGAEYQRLSALYGPFREVVAIVRDPATGELAAGANFIVFPLRTGGIELLSMNLNYVFVAAGHRRKGHFARLIASLPEIASGYFTEPSGDQAEGWPRLHIFIEQNDPLRMDPADYALDTAHSGIDQLQRIRLWAALGAHIIDFDYVQPGLSADQAPDHSLVYGVLGAGAAPLDACLLREHLIRFFGISVLKGSTQPEDNDAAAPQLAALAGLCACDTPLPLLSPSRLPQSPAAPASGPSVRSLRDFIKAPG